MLKDLRTHVAELKERGRWLEVDAEVDPRHELAAVARAIHRETGCGVLFRKVRGSPLPVVSYVLPDRTEAVRSLGFSPSTYLEEWFQGEGRRGELAHVSAAPVQEVVDTSPDLRQLPIPTYCEGDAGPYITGGLVISKHPDTGATNASFNRLQLVASRKLRVRMMPPQHLGIYHARAEAKGVPLPVAIVIGAPPAAMFSGASKIPLDRDELEFAAALAGEPLRLVKCRTVDVDVPADAEIVIEGNVLPDVREEEGPFGEFTDSYVPVMRNHVMEVTAITRRRDALYHTIFAGGHEDLCLLGIPIEAEVYKHIRRYGVIKGISTTGFVFGVVVAIEKQNEYQPRDIILTTLGSYSWVKFCVVVDDDVDIHDAADVLWAIQTRCCPDKGIIHVPGVSSYTREDVRSIHEGKVGIDATVRLDMKDIMRRRKIPGEATLDLSRYLPARR